MSLAPCYKDSRVCSLLIYVLVLQLSTPLTMRISLDLKVRSIKFDYLIQISYSTVLLLHGTAINIEDVILCYYLCFIQVDGQKYFKHFHLTPKTFLFDSLPLFWMSYSNDVTTVIYLLLILFEILQNQDTIKKMNLELGWRI
jgi:hypothetical protein